VVVTSIILFEVVGRGREGGIRARTHRLVVMSSFNRCMHLPHDVRAFQQYPALLPFWRGGLLLHRGLCRSQSLVGLAGCSSESVTCGGVGVGVGPRCEQQVNSTTESIIV